MADYGALRPLRRLPGTDGAAHSFSLLTYNILAQGKVSREDYSYAAGPALKWRTRRGLLSAEIAAYDADVACFQEMDRWHEHFRPLLTRLGYDAAAADRGSDHNVVAWKRERFEPIATRVVSLAETTAADYAEATPNVVVLAALRLRARPDTALAVATSHFYWRPEAHGVRRAQMELLLASLAAFARETLDAPGVVRVVPVVAGDFNSAHGNPAIRAVLEEQGGRFADAHARYAEVDASPRPTFRRGLRGPLEDASPSESRVGDGERDADSGDLACPQPTDSAAVSTAKLSAASGDSTCALAADNAAVSTAKFSADSDDSTSPQSAESAIVSTAEPSADSGDSTCPSSKDRSASVGTAGPSADSEESTCAQSQASSTPTHSPDTPSDSDIVFAQSGVPYTTFCKYVWTLDHVFHGQGDYAARPEALGRAVRVVPTALRVLPAQGEVERETALPNSVYASDHVALHVVFGLFDEA